MVAFYWVMGMLVAGTFAPSVLYMVLYVLTGEHACARRAKTFWNFTGVFAMLGLNLLIWVHIVVALWQIWS